MIRNLAGPQSGGPPEEMHVRDDPEPCDDDRPWERPGAVRRDCEPHRGEMLLLLWRVRPAGGRSATGGAARGGGRA